MATRAAMGVRANNYFGRVWRTAVRPGCRGNWRCFQAVQVLEVLYQKKLVVYEPADWGITARTWRARPGDRTE